MQALALDKSQTAVVEKRPCPPACCYKHAIIYQHHIEFAHLFREGYNRYLMEALADFNDRSKKALFVVLPLYYSGEEWLESLVYLAGRGVPVSPTIVSATRTVLNISACFNRNRG